jgi:GNAT superfamily N-acetyltransferase
MTTRKKARLNPSLNVRRANLDDPADQQAIIELLDMYCREPLVGGCPLPDDVRQRLIPGLRRYADCRTFLACHDSKPIGLAVCFVGFSSFRAKPLINIHDLAVTPECRGQGVGRALLSAVEEEARREGCCRLTLEVRADNHHARALYQNLGFEPGDPATDALHFWKKSLE